MTTGQLVVITLRLVVPLLILRKPLAGGSPPWRSTPRTSSLSSCSVRAGWARTTRTTRQGVGPLLPGPRSLGFAQLDRADTAIDQHLALRLAGSGRRPVPQLVRILVPVRPRHLAILPKRPAGHLAPVPDLADHPPHPEAGPGIPVAHCGSATLVVVQVVTVRCPRQRAGSPAGGCPSRCEAHSAIAWAGRTNHTWRQPARR